MEIAIVGGTHGNEPVGVEVVKAIRNLQPKSPFHTYETFIGNPEALKQRVRFIDSDLNRAFGKNGRPKGYELKRSKELKNRLQGSFDLILDLHTTTSNMGLTAILNNSHTTTRQACCFLKESTASFKLIEEDQLDDESTHLNRLAPAGVTIEVGPVANNVVSGDLVVKTYQMVVDLLNFDFKRDFDFKRTEVFKTVDRVFFPQEGQWFIHPKIENKDFEPLKPQTPLFQNIKGEALKSTYDEVLYPFFINEAAYLKDRSAMILAKKTIGFT